MTIMLTFDLLVYFYWLVENYLFIRVQELKVQQYYAYYERLAEWVEDCSQPEDTVEHQDSMLEAPHVQENILAPVVPIKPVVIQPELNEMTEGLFAELQLELGINNISTEEVDYELFATFEIDEEPAGYGFDYDIVSLAGYDEQGFMEEEVYVAEYEEEVVDNQEDCIHMDDLMREEEISSPIGYESFASAKIVDGIEGPQQWVVSVIGMEEQYIHVSDGKRIWINVGERASRIRKNDVLILDVIRNGKEIQVENLVRVESFANDDYMIPDEERFLAEEEVQIAI